MADYADLELAKIEKEIHQVYTQAQKELQDKWDKYMAKAQPKVDKAKAAAEAAMLDPNMDPVKAQKLNDAYQKAVLNMTLQNAHYQEMVNQTTNKLAETNQIALSYINDQMPKVYCHSYNEFADQHIAGYSFELVNEDAVKHLVKSGNTNLLPQKKLNFEKDKAWNTKQINSEVLQGILQGESMDEISKRLFSVIHDPKETNKNIVHKNEVSARRAAQTMVTGAQNKGRQDSFERASNDGVKMKRIWVAAHDDRTRTSHLDLHGKSVAVDEPFHSMYGDIMYPGDPSADPRDVYNCRCAIRVKVLGFDWSKQPEPEYKSAHKGTGEPIKPEAAKKASVVVQEAPKPDLGMYQDKSMTATFYSVKAENKDLGKEFWAVLHAEDKPSDAWKQYLIGTAPKEVTEKLDKILLQHKGEGAWTKPVSAKKAAKTKAAADAGDDLVKAQSQLAVAEGNLNSVPNKTYSGIWKDPVSLSDYEIKAGSIAAKKQWYYDQIEDLTHKIDAGDVVESVANAKIAQYEKYLDDLVDFETQGKLYAQYAKEYQAAFDNVKKLTPVSETFGPDVYSMARKNAALWAKNDAEYKTIDKYYEKEAKKVHGAKTTAEHEGYYHYTWGSGPFNQPLAGFDGSWSESNFKGPGKVNIDSNGYGDKIRGLTSLCEKSKYDKDFWVQSGQSTDTLAGFLELPRGIFNGMSDADLQQFVGIEKEIPQFISGAINKGGGSYTPGNMLFNIYCPAGSEALYVRSDGHFGKHEHEMILQRGGTYKITKIYWGKDTTTGSKKLIVDLELHPEKGYNKFQQKK